ncbi:MAG: sulfotransferase [Nitrospira sp.]|nr:sulfotransferase [Nitrospira sp.]
MRKISLWSQAFTFLIGLFHWKHQTLFFLGHPLTCLPAKGFWQGLCKDMSIRVASKAERPESALLQQVQKALKKQDWSAIKQLCHEELQVNPFEPDAHRFLGQLYSLLGQPEQALQAAERATELAPQDPRTWSDLGRVHVRAQVWTQAIQSFSRSIQLDPQYADGWHNLGTALKQIGERERAFDALKRALQIDATRAETYLTLGNLLVDAEQLEEAIQCFQWAAMHDPTMARARSRLAQELSQQGRVTHAESLFRESLGLDPDDMSSWFGLGRTLEDLGQAEAALGCYRNILGRMPGNALALGHYLSLVKEDEDGARWLIHAHQALGREQTPDEARALLGYGLAKYHDRCGHVQPAAEAGVLANAARRKKSGPLDREALTARVDQMTQTYTKEFFLARRHYGVGTDQPVFIVGLPRSGTTLTEQILSAHPQVHGAGELPDLARLAGQILHEEGDAPWQSALQLTEMPSRDFAHRYLEALRQGAPHDPLRISDKQPLNFFQLAFAAVLFPNARVVYCHRGARDNALSIWLENFNPDQRYATDFEDLAWFTAMSRRMMQHWKNDLPLPILDFRYEDTVADLEGQARRLIDFLGIPWDARCLDFHRVDRAVQTPSRWQVRQPIYTRSVGRWKHYAPYLPGLEQAFAQFDDPESPTGTSPT